MILLQKKSVCSIMNTYKTHEMISNCLTQKTDKDREVSWNINFKDNGKSELWITRKVIWLL